MTRWHSVVVLSTSALALSGCKGRSQAVPVPPVAAAAAAPAAAGESGPPVPAFADDRGGHMKAHFVRALKLQDAVLAGKLEDARAQGKWLSEHEAPDVPASWKPYLTTFQLEAKSVATARGLDEAAIGVGHIAAACGACHEGNKAKPHMVHKPIVERAQNVKQHMGDHVAALDRMWEGLVAPSDAAWTAGAALLSQVVVSEKDLKREGKDKTELASVLVETLKQVAANAGQAEKKERPRAYADLLTTCVACHTAVRKPPETGGAPAPAAK